MNISNFPASRVLQDVPSTWLSKLLGTAYAFHAYAHQKKEYIDDSKVGGRILGGFPVWYISREPVVARPGASFVRNVSGENYWFYRSGSEFVAIQFCSLDGSDLREDSTVFCQINDSSVEGPRLSSTFIVSMESLTRMGLFLDYLGKQRAYPRIIVFPKTGQCGLLVTTNHWVARDPREHVVFPLPELSFGRANRHNDDFRDAVMPLEKFLLSSAYPMKIASEDDGDLGTID